MKKYETDWLASKPVFYNTKTLRISHNINDVIDWSNIEFHPEGLNNYLDFGYSVFLQTPLKNVRFLRHSSEIWVENNKLKIVEKPDPVNKWFEENKGYKDEREVIELIRKKVREWEKRTKGDIVIPLSGGYDSRLLACLIENKSRLKAFTYGISNEQDNSLEVVKAREISKRMRIDWRQISLGDYHIYLDKWDQYFGISTHAHGMYHVEFYQKMKQYLNGGELFLSGIFGDVWAGSVEYQDVKGANRLSSLGYTHGLVSDSRYSVLSSDNKIQKDFYTENIEQIQDRRQQIILTIRIKMILISYLVSLPNRYDFDPWSPYLDMDVALSMLSIDPRRRRGRLWQKDFFREVDLDLEESSLGGDRRNTLNYQAMKRVKLSPLNSELLAEIFNEKYLEKINRCLINPSLYDRSIQKLYQIIPTSRFGGLFMGGLEKLGIRDKISTMYYAYLTLKPIENVLHKRNKYLKKGHI